MSAPLLPLLREKRVLVCVGPGGVGKTTLAAATALKAASQGRKVLVLTIDPARRLASSLGLPELGNVEKRIPPETLAAAGVEVKGELYAMMLDLKRTWDDLVSRFAPTPEQREAIFANRFYQQLSTALAGSLEYMATEKLYELHVDRDYDLVVLDTPPTAHALDFLDAPNRVLDVLHNDAARWLLTPALAAGKIGLRLFSHSGGYVFRTISRFTGLKTLEELASFLQSLHGMYDGFKERAARVKELLASPQTAFLLVTSPNALAVDEATYFHAQLAQERMPVGAVLANRVHLPPEGPEPTLPEVERSFGSLASGPEGAAPLAQRLLQTYRDAAVLAGNDRIQLERLSQGCPGVPLLSVPRQDSDVHDLRGLWKLGGHLC